MVRREAVQPALTIPARGFQDHGRPWQKTRFIQRQDPGNGKRRFDSSIASWENRHETTPRPSAQANDPRRGGAAVVWCNVPIADGIARQPREWRRAAAWLRRVADWWEFLADQQEAKEEGR